MCTRGSLIVRLVVLIDTWWNVNKIKAKVFEEGKAVLIDTWWNVNDGNTIFSDFLYAF